MSDSDQATGYANQHIWCLSQTRINWEGCVRKGILRKKWWGWQRWRHQLVWMRRQSIRTFGASACVIFILHQKIQKMAKRIFWYQLTWVVPDKIQRAVKWLSMWLWRSFWIICFHAVQIASFTYYTGFGPHLIDMGFRELCHLVWLGVKLYMSVQCPVHYSSTPYRVCILVKSMIWVCWLRSGCVPHQPTAVAWSGLVNWQYS